MNPYDKNTLHVAITGGQENARTYIALDLSDLPAVFELGEAVLTLPIDPKAPTLNAETARVQICLSDLPPKSEEGSFEEPPKTDCKTKAPATYRAKPKPHLEADITDFGDDLAFSGLAIMPSDRAKEKKDTWHLTFYGKRNKAKAARPITAELTVLPAEDIFDLDPQPSSSPTALGPSEGGSSTSFGSGDSGDVPAFGSATGSSVGPPLESGNVTSPPETAEEPVDVEDEPAPAAALDLNLPTDLELEPAYTIVWAVPLLLLALSFYFGSALTRKVTIRGGGRR